MSHTSTPWNVSGNHYDDEGYPETVISAMNGAASVAVTLEFGANNPLMREANARRIVACVNACSGVETETLEKAGKVLQLATDEIISQRDTYRDLCGELLAHLKKEYNNPTVRRDYAIEGVITRAESVMGENSNG